MSSKIPEIRVYSPSEKGDNINDNADVFRWHSPKFEVKSSFHPIKSEKQHFRFFGSNNRGSNVYFQSNRCSTDIRPLGLVKWENNFNMRSYNLANFPTSTTSYRTAYRSQAVAMQRAKLGLITGTAKSLDILRQNLQKIINKEIDEIIQKYLDKFFKPGIENIKVNNGENSVSEQHIQTVCQQILEEAKKMYQSDLPPTNSQTEIPEVEPVAPPSEPKVIRSFPKTLSKKRKDSDTDSEASIVTVKPKRKKGRPPIHTPASNSGRSTPMKLKIEQVKREGPKWDPARITPETKFIMGAKANKALGLGATRGRLYIKHPEIFKYSGDQEDKQWLYDHNLMPATGGKAYMLFVDDIKELAESEECRSNPALMVDEIIGFTIPDSMSQKMKLAMKQMRTAVPTRRRGRPPVSCLEGNFDIKVEDITSDEKHESGTATPTDELDLLNSEMRSTNPSPFSLGPGFDDVSPAQPEISPAPSDLSATLEPPTSAPFDISSTP